MGYISIPKTCAELSWRCSCDTAECVVVYLAHFACFTRPIQSIVINNAEGIGPYILNLQRTGNINSVLGHGGKSFHPILVIMDDSLDLRSVRDTEFPH